MHTDLMFHFGLHDFDGDGRLPTPDFSGAISIPEGNKASHDSPTVRYLEGCLIRDACCILTLSCLKCACPTAVRKSAIPQLLPSALL
jgi:hypothetical protein